MIVGLVLGLKAKIFGLEAQVLNLGLTALALPPKALALARLCLVFGLAFYLTALLSSQTCNGW